MIRKEFYAFLFALAGLAIAGGVKSFVDVSVLKERIVSANEKIEANKRQLTKRLDRIENKIDIIIQRTK